MHFKVFFHIVIHLLKNRNIENELCNKVFGRLDQLWPQSFTVIVLKTRPQICIYIYY